MSDPRARSRRNAARPGSPAGRNRAPRPAPARRPAPAASRTPGWRGQLESWSYPLLSRLSDAPRWVTGVGAAVLLLGGLFAPSPYGPVLLLVAVAFFAWLVTLSWPRLSPGARASRTAVVAVLIGVVVLKFLDLP